jgi:Flp pilus assembly protein TadG
MSRKRQIRSLLRERSGIAAVEFALLVPTVVVMFFATYEASLMIRAKMKFDNAATTIASLVALQTPQSTGSLTADFCTGAGYMMAPFPTGITVQINSVTNKSGTATVDWTANCGTLSGPQSATTLASGLIPTSGDSVIVVQTKYTYTAPFSMILAASYTFSNVGYARPRNNGTVNYAP